MGNTLTCCVSPSASPKLGGRTGPAETNCESDSYEAAAGDAVAVGAAQSPAAVEPSELDLGAGEGHHLQHISDREMPEGKRRRARLPPRGPQGVAASSGSFLPRAGRRGPACLGPTLVLTPLRDWQGLYHHHPFPNAQFLTPHTSPSQSGILPVCSCILCSVGL